MISNEIYFGNETTSTKILKSIKDYKITKEDPIKFTIFQNFKNYFIPFTGNIRIKIKSLLLNNKQLKDQKINKFISSIEVSNKINLINNGKHSIKIKEVTREVFQIEKI